MLAQVAAHGVWKLTQPWTHRTRPPLLAKRADAFRTAPTTRHQVSLLRRTKDTNSFRPQAQSPTDSAEEAVFFEQRACGFVALVVHVGLERSRIMQPPAHRLSSQPRRGTTGSANVH